LDILAAVINRRYHYGYPVARINFSRVDAAQRGVSHFIKVSS